MLKVTLQSVKLLLTVSYRKNWGAGCNSCSPNDFVGGATAPPAPAPMPMQYPACSLQKLTMYAEIAASVGDNNEIFHAKSIPAR